MDEPEADVQTLIDWETGMKDALKPLLSQPNNPGADKLVELVGKHARVIETGEPGTPYPKW